ELSTIQYYTPEEQLIELTAALKEQFPRHCFIKIGTQKTQPLLVPFVKEFYTSRTNRQWYDNKQAVKQQALSGDKVDEIIDAQEQDLLNRAGLNRGTEVLVGGSAQSVEPLEPIESAGPTQALIPQLLRLRSRLELKRRTKAARWTKCSK